MPLVDTAGYFARHQRMLFALCTIYVLGLILSHSTLPAGHVWGIAVFFSVAMNFTYMIEARAIRSAIGTEIFVAFGLIALSMAALFFSPLLVILAIFGHGLWDVAKHWGKGVRFLSWYTWSCAIIDFSYGTVLACYWLLS